MTLHAFISAITLIVSTVYAGLCHACDTPCGHISSEFIQITVGTLNTGTKRYEAFRLLDNGTLLRAKWDSYRTLLEVAKPVNIGIERYTETTRLVTNHQAPQPPGRDPFASRTLKLDLAQLTDGRVYFATLDEIPNDIEALLDEWRLASPGLPPKPGNYLWTAPYARIGAVDLDITLGSCNTSSAASTLSKALQSGHLIEPVDRNLDRFLTGENKFRTQFGATFPAGYVRFGVVTANP